MTDIRCHELNLTRPTLSVPEVSGGFVRTLIRLPAALIDTLLLWQERAAELELEAQLPRADAELWAADELGLLL